MSLAKTNDVQWTNWHTGSLCVYKIGHGGIVEKEFNIPPECKHTDAHFRALQRRTGQPAQTAKFKQKGLGHFSQLIIDSSELQEVQQKLWTKDKYDVGLVKGTEPLHVTPRRTYRPCRAQYPLKQEAVLVNTSI